MSTHTDLVLADRQQMSTFEVMGDAWELAQRISKTELVPNALRNKPEAVMAVVLMGHEVGLPPMASLQQINMIQGTPAPSAQSMRALVQSHGHEMWPEEMNTTRVVWCGRRAGESNVVKSTYTMDDAKRANLAGKPNWRAMPQDMLSARASSRLCRMLFADVLLGISYSREELEDGDVFEPPASNGDAAPVKTQTRKAKTAAKKAGGKAEQASLPAADPPPDPFEDEGGEDPEQRRRSVSIITACNAAGVDRHHLISAVTGGVHTSSMAVTGEQALQVLQAVRDVEDGRASLEESDGGWLLVAVDPDEVVDAVLVDGPDGSDGPEDRPGVGAPAGPGAEVEWDADGWQAFLLAAGVSPVRALKALRSLCGELGQRPPAGMLDVYGDEVLAPLLRGLVDEGRA